MPQPACPLPNTKGAEQRSVSSTDTSRRITQLEQKTTPTTTLKKKAILQPIEFSLPPACKQM